MQRWPQRSKDDDNEFLVDRFEDFVRSAGSSPFLAIIDFHSVHIPYVSPAAFRARYANLTLNEQDYYGAIEAMDAQIGRIRALLRELNVADDTIMWFMADNGPEVSTKGDVETSAGWPFYRNPGSTGGHRGRKRDFTEGGIRVPGLVEWPAVVKKNRAVQMPLGTVDLKATVMDLLRVQDPHGWPADGVSMAPLLRDEASARGRPLGFATSGRFGNGGKTGVCGTGGAASGEPIVAGRDPQNDAAAAVAPMQQLAWMGGTDADQQYKLFACRNSAEDDWSYFLYDLLNDHAETEDLGATLPELRASMIRELTDWLASVEHSQGADETNCIAQFPPSLLL